MTVVALSVSAAVESRRGKGGYHRALHLLLLHGDVGKESLCYRVSLGLCRRVRHPGDA